MEKIITANNILETFFKLLSLSPEVDKWSEEEFKDNEPRLYRYLQLISLLKAFNIPLNIQSFINGDFIDSEDQKYKKTMMYMGENSKPPCCMMNGKYLQRAFTRMLDYRMKVNDLINYNAGVYLASGEYKYACMKINGLNRVIKDNLSEYDKILLSIISPEQQTYTIDDMTQNFDYPDVDFDEIDWKHF